MARRKDGFTELLKIASKLPWKVSACFAPISYVVLHLIAAAFAQTVPVTDLADMGSVVIHQYIHIFAALLQYVVPLIFLVGATASFLRRSRSMSLFDGVRSNDAFKITSLSWQEFETLVGEGFRHRGFQVTDRGGAAPDGGIDLELSRGNERFLVQCKQYRAQHVGVTVVRELYGVMAAEGAAGGFVVTSGRFTKDAQHFASGRNIELIDGDGVDALLRAGNATIKKLDISSTHAQPREAQTPVCPRCGTTMVPRIAKQGSNAGKRFWGCRQYPRCRAIVPVT